MTRVANSPDVALDALFVPFNRAELRAPDDGRVLFLHAREGVALREHATAAWLCQQSFKPFADALVHGGYRVGEPARDALFAQVLLLPPRQRDERRALFARAANYLQPGGTVVTCVANVEGAKSAESDFARLFGPVRTVSTHKCRVFWNAGIDAQVDSALRDEWLALDVPRTIAAGFVSRPGLFAWNRIDPASASLAAHLPDDLHGRIADLGAGYGYLATQLVARFPRITAIDLYEADARALEPARSNLANALREAGRAVEIGVHWHDVTAGLPQRYDGIVSNPPFHQGRADLPELGRAFIASAADALQPDGRLYLVANRHLPYESMLTARFSHVRTLAHTQGFKVITATGVHA